MARLIYSGITALDGHVADANGRFDRAEPDEEVHTFVEGVRLSLDLVGERRFGNGVVHLRHRIGT
jgi:hypothetical protein